MEKLGVLVDQIMALNITSIIQDGVRTLIPQKR